eukprot:178031-Pelagomonas_calceolata.AAC.5
MKGVPALPDQRYMLSPHLSACIKAEIASSCNKGETGSLIISNNYIAGHTKSNEQLDESACGVGECLDVLENLPILHTVTQHYKTTSILPTQAHADPQTHTHPPLPPIYLSVVHGEGHAQHILGVAHEAAGGGAGVQVPQAQGSVPGAGQAELAIARDDHVLHEVGVAAQGLLGVAVAVTSALQLPHNHALVAASNMTTRCVGKLKGMRALRLHGLHAQQHSS